MAREIKPINYAEEYHEMRPSLFRESENLDRLLQALFDVCDVQQRGFLWLSENLLNVDVAQGFHLDFIGGIVGQPRFLSDFNTEPYFGFDKSYQSKTFGSALDPEVGGYWNSRSYFNTATSRQLNDEEYRRLIKARSIYNQSNCSANDLLQVVNLVTDSSNNTVQMLRHGLIQINTDDETGILSYFVDRLLNEDNILPIAAGVRVGLESSAKKKMVSYNFSSRPYPSLIELVDIYEPTILPLEMSKKTSLKTTSIEDTYKAGLQVGSFTMKSLVVQEDINKKDNFKVSLNVKVFEKRKILIGQNVEGEDSFVVSMMPVEMKKSNFLIINRNNDKETYKPDLRVLGITKN